MTMTPKADDAEILARLIRERFELVRKLEAIDDTIKTLLRPADPGEDERAQWLKENQPGLTFAQQIGLR